MRFTLAALLLLACPGRPVELDAGSDDAGSADAGVTEPDAGDAATPDAGSTAARCIDDVALRFSELPTEVDSTLYLGARNDGGIAWPHYTSDSSNSFGVGEHVESIQRYGRYLLLTGAGAHFSPPAAHLIVLEIGAWSGVDWQNPPPENNIVALVELDRASWHAGGTQLFEDVLAIPFYGAVNNQSDIRLYRVSDPRSPVELTRIPRSGTEAKAVALTDRPDGGYLLLAWDDATLDFFVSPALDGGFTPVSSLTPDAGFQSGGCGLSGCGTYQNVNFVRQCDGALFFIGTRNTQKLAPTVDGDDLATLYRVDGDGQAISFVARRAFGCHDQQCNFGAGAGIVVRDSTHLELYGASHWLHDGNRRYNFNLYR